MGGVINKKGNKIENWEQDYKPLKTTYTEVVINPSQFDEACGYEYILEDIERYLSNAKGAKIIEVGCGGARTSTFLARRGYDVTCSDFTPEAIRLARANFDLFKAQGSFLIDDLMNSKVAEAAYDCVMSFGLLEHFEELEPLVANLSRLIKPGGLHIHLVITKKFSTESIRRVIWFPYQLLHFTIKEREFKNIIKKSYRDFPHYENSYPAREYVKAFATGGNEVLRCEPRSVLLPLIYMPLKPGNILVKYFPQTMKSLFKRLDRTQSRLLHILAPAFCIVCRKKGLETHINAAG